VLQRAEDSCLIVNSLRGASRLVMSITVNDQREAAGTALSSERVAAPQA
jgi:hypothetical protein